MKMIVNTILRITCRGELQLEEIQSCDLMFPVFEEVQDVIFVAVESSCWQTVSGKWSTLSDICKGLSCNIPWGKRFLKRNSSLYLTSNWIVGQHLTDMRFAPLYR